MTSRNPARSFPPLPALRSIVSCAAALVAAACGRSSEASRLSAAPKQAQRALLSPVFSEDFESGLGSWTAATTSGSCTWHTPDHPETLQINRGPDARCGGSGLNPFCVRVPDTGAHLPAAGGTHVAWFGEDSTGTYLGSDYGSQSPDSGGAGKQRQRGTLTSPSISLVGQKALLEFDSWWEIEGVAGQAYDTMWVRVSSDNGATWQDLGELNPTFATNQPGNAGFTAGGPSTAPVWRHYAFDLSNKAGSTVKLQFTFDSGDAQYNAFRGWSFDNLVVSSGSSFAAPAITSVSPAAGTANDVVSINGSNFLQGATFAIGATTIGAQSITQFGSTYLIFQVPGLADGTYPVQVTNPDGQTFTLPNAFTYASAPSPQVNSVSPATGTVGAAQSVVISGSDFVSGATVQVGSASATGVSFVDATTLNATFPGLLSGIYNVTVSNPSGQSGTSFSAYTVPAASDNSTISVTSPSGGESWAAGSSQTVTWSTTGTISDVAIDLVQSGATVTTLTASTPASSGTFGWAIPASTTPGSGYTIKIYNPQGSSSAFSAAPFSIVAPTGIAVSSGSASYVSPGAGVAIDPNLTVSSAANLTSAAVSISSGFVSSQDVLGFVAQSGITGSYSAATGILALSGNATAAAYQAALRSVTYSNSAGASANTAARSISFSLGSGLYYSGNGHFYEYVASSGITWANARTAAAGKSYFGLQGYLATVTSAGENTFIKAKLGGNGWMGASTPVFTIPRTWSWVTGPEAGTAFFTQTAQQPSGGGTSIGGAYSNWATGEPNNYGGVENYAHFYSSNGTWNDFAGNNGSIAGYAVEYGGMAGDPTVLLSGTRSLSITLGAFVVTFQTDGTAGASLSGAVSQTVTAGGNTSAVQAASSSNTYFVNWTGTGGFATSSANPLTVSNVTGPMSITAHFAAKATSSVALGSTASTSESGQAVSFSASLTPASATGTVQFTVDGANLGAAVPIVAGAATSAALSNLAVGSHALTAVYSGNGTQLGASGSATQVVIRAATATSVSVSPPAPTYGGSVTLTATISLSGQGAGTPSGTVAFAVNGAAIAGCGAQTVSSSSATCTTTALPAGSDTLSAAYSGDGSFAPSSGSAQATVSKAAPASFTLDAQSLSRTYDGGPKSATATTSPAGLTVSFTYDGSATPPTLAGSYTVVATLQDPSYQGTVSGTLVIDKGSPVVTWPAPPPLAYATPLGARLNATASVPGTFVYAPPAGTVLDAGLAQTLQVTFTPADGANYLPVTQTVSLEVTQRAQTISFGALGTVVYGAADFASGASVSSGLALTYSSDTPAVATITSGGLVHLAGAGTATLTATQAGDANSLPASAQAQLTVAPAPLVVRALDASRAAGAMNPVFAASFSGFVLGETAAVLTGAPALDSAATGESAAGSYPITAQPGTLSAANYRFTFLPGTLAVGLTAQIISFNPPATATYGEAPFALSATGGGSPNQVSFTSSDPGVAFLSGNLLSIVGVGEVVLSASQPGDETYAAGSAQQILTILPAPIQVAVQDASRPYGAANPAFAATISGLVNGDSSDVLSGAPALSTSADASSPMGSYPITATQGTLAAANYRFVFSSGTLGVGLASQTLGFAALPAQVYGDAPFTLSAKSGASGTAVSFASTNPAVASVSGSTVTISGAGDTVILATEPSDGSYASATASQTLHIAPAPLTVTAQDQTRLYGQPEPGFTASFSGFVLSDDQSVLAGAPSLTTQATLTSPVGAYGIAAGAGNLSAANYRFLFAGGTLSITASGSTTALSSVPADAVFGQQVTFSATVAQAGGSASQPTGVVTFTEGESVLGTGTLSSGVAIFQTTALAVGSHDVIASYAGDTNFNGSSSDPSTQTIAQAPTAVLFSATPAAPVVGEAVTLSATVTSAGGTPDGSVTFSDGATVLAVLALDPSGFATFSTSSLGLGAHALSASYGGAANYLGSSGSQPITVGQASTSSALVASAASTLFGQAFTLTASVVTQEPGSGTPAGSFSFQDGESVLGVVALDSSGAASLTFASLAVGAHSITAVYGGSLSFGGSTSSGVPHAVGKGSVSASLSSSTSTSVGSQPVTFTASLLVVAPAAGAPSGLISFSDGEALLGSGTVANGAASFTTSALSVGSHSITATYSGDGSFTQTSSVATQSVGLATPVVAVSLSPLSPAYGQALSIRATVAAAAPATAIPSGPVVIKDGATTLGTVALDSSGNATLSTSALLAGSHAISVEYGGDPIFATGSTSAAAVIAIGKAATALALVPAPAALVSGQAARFSLTVTSAGGIPTGLVTLQDGSQLLGTAALSGGAVTLSLPGGLLAGAHSLSASYPGDPNFAGSSTTPPALIVARAASTLALDASVNPLRVNRPVTFVAQVSAVSPGTGVASGTVTFSDGAQSLGEVSLVAGAASLTIPSLRAGNHAITAAYAGSSELTGSTGTLAGGEVIEKSAPVAGSGSAVSFDGAHQAAAVEDPAGALDGARTVELWFERSAADQPGAPACLVQHGEGSALRFGLCLSAARDGFQVRRGAETVSVQAALPSGFHHVALVDRGTETTLHLDGAEIASLAGGFGTGSAQTLTLAAAGAARADRFAGSLDEVRLWSSARLPSELSDNSMRPVVAGVTGLAGLWRMDEGAGEAFYDAGPAHLVAKLEGAPAWLASTAWRVRVTSEEHGLDPFIAGYDPDGAPFTVAISAQAQNGIARVSESSTPGDAALSGVLDYMPAAKFVGTDSFTYSVTSGSLSSSFTSEVKVLHVDSCQTQSDCRGGDVCTNNVCEAPAGLRSISGGCSSAPSDTGAPMLLPLALLVFFFLRRPRHSLARAKATMTPRRSFKLLALAVVTCAGAARAESGFALETYQPAPAGDRFFAVPDAEVQDHLEPSFGLQLGYAHAPLVLESGGRPLANGRLVQDQLGVRLGGSLPLFGLLLVDADLGMSAWQRGEMPFNGQASLSATAFSDPRLGARVALFQRDALSLSAGLSVWIPLGSQRNYGSDGTVRALPQLLASGTRGRFSWASEAGVELRRAAETMFTRSGPALRLSVAGGLSFLDGRLQVGPEVYSRVQFNEARNSSLEALFGARLTRGDFTFGAALGSRFIENAPGAAPLRIIGQITFNGLDWLNHRRPASTHPLAQPLSLVRSAAPAPVAAPAPAPQVAVALVAEPVAPAPVLQPAPEPASEPAPAKPDPDAALARIEDGHVEFLRPVKFAHDRAELLSGSEPALIAAAAALRAHPELASVVVAGFGDSHGSVKRNLDLTTRRAAAVRTWFIHHSIASSRLSAVGCGSASPIASNETEEGRAENRRVELKPAGAGACSR